MIIQHQKNEEGTHAWTKKGSHWTSGIIKSRYHLPNDSTTNNHAPSGDSATHIGQNKMSWVQQVEAFIPSWKLRTKAWSGVEF
jgi:hypothetical protein